MRRQRANQTRGLTLVETLVALAILIVLAGIIYAVLGPVREKGRQSVCISNLKQIGQALSMYRADYNGTDGPGPYYEMGFPPNEGVLFRYMGWKGKLPDDPPKWDCPNRPKWVWGAYSYNVCDDERPDPRVFPCTPTFPGTVSQPIPSFEKRIEKHGDNYAVVFDVWHDRYGVPTPASLHDEPIFLIMLSLGGQVKAQYLPRKVPSFEYAIK